MKHFMLGTMFWNIKILRLLIFVMKLRATSTWSTCWT